jgi:hypothetical protein
LQNWALWAVSGARTSISSAYDGVWNDVAPRPPPPLIGEATDTDTLIAKLSTVHRDALTAHYVWTGPAELKAQQLGCCVTSMANRVRAAKFRLDDLYQASKGAAR